jgi:hypothetical protein
MTDENQAVERVNQAEFARRLGVSRAAVGKAIRSGRITLGADGKLDPITAQREWLDNTRACAQSATAKQPRGGQTRYNSARARKEHALASIAELKLAHLRGELVRADGVRAAASEAMTLVRVAFERMPDHLAEELAGQPLEDVRERLRAEIEQGLHYAADLMHKAAERACRVEADPDGGEAGQNNPGHDTDQNGRESGGKRPKV